MSSLRNPRVWIGVAVSAASIALLFYQVKIQEVGSALTRVNYAWLVLGIAVEMVSLWIRGARWRVILEETVKVSNSYAFSVLIIGYAANNLLPLRAGELVRAHLVYVQHGTSRLSTLGTILVERIFDVLVLALMVAGPVVLLGSSVAYRNTAFLVLAAAGFATVVLALFALWSGFSRFVLSTTSLLPTGVRPKVRALLESFMDGVVALRRPGPWLAVSAFSLASWAIESVAYWLVGIGFGLDLNPLVYVMLCGVATLVLAAPTTAGGLGVFELSVQAVATSFGVPIATATAYAIGIHVLVLLLPVIVLGLALLWRQNLGISSMVQAQSAGTE